MNMVVVKVNVETKKKRDAGTKRKGTRGLHDMHSLFVDDP